MILDSQTTQPSRQRYALVGNPIAHSKSPFIHQQFASQFGIALRYEKIEPPADGFAEAVRDFFAAGGNGLNVTVPFKHEAFTLATSHSERAHRAAAVNTLSMDAAGTLRGDNTDGIGLVRDLRDNHGITISARRLLIIGAGGAVRGILGPLLDEQPAAIDIINRTAERAARLAHEFNGNGTVLHGGGYSLAGQHYDIVLHASAATPHHQTPPLPKNIFTATTLACDLVYGENETPFLRTAHHAGATHTMDGIGMLVEQAAESFALWHGHHPQTAPVIAAIRKTQR